MASLSGYSHHGGISSIKNKNKECYHPKYTCIFINNIFKRFSDIFIIKDEHNLLLFNKLIITNTL